MANRSAACALRLLPAARLPWGRGMLSEMTYLDDRAALRWALGCAVASLKMRFYAMMFGNLKISRAILAPEMLLCFLTPCLVWSNCTGILWDMAHRNAPYLPEYFLDTPDGRIMLVQFVVGALLGWVGPVGLVASLWAIVSRRPLTNRYVGAGCLAGSVILGLVYFASAIFLEPRSLQNPDMWRWWLLLTLPILAALHLILIGLWPARRSASAIIGP